MEAAVASASLVMSIRGPSGASAVVPMGRAREASFSPRSLATPGWKAWRRWATPETLKPGANSRVSAAPPVRSAASSTVTFSPALAR